MNIRKAVMLAINEKIKSAQINCDVEVALLKKERKDSTSKAWDTLWLELARIANIFKSRKEETVKRHVNSILSKVI